MDASASAKENLDFSKVCGFFVEIKNAGFPTHLNQKNTVIKYTKLPEFGFNSKASVTQKSYSLQPRLRRIVTLDDQKIESSRSLKNDLVAPMKTMSSLTKRKIVTITEDEENDLHPKFSRENNKAVSLQTSNRVIEGDFRQEKEPTQRSTSRLNPKYPKKSDSKPSAKHTMTNRSKDINSSKESNSPKSNNRSKYTNVGTGPITDHTTTRKVKEKETRTRDLNNKHTNASIKSSLSRKLGPTRDSEKEVYLIKNTLTESLRSNVPPKKITDKPRLKSSPVPRKEAIKDIKSKIKPMTYIHVPLDNKYQHRKTVETETTKFTVRKQVHNDLSKNYCNIEVEKISCKDTGVGTDPEPTKIETETETEKIVLDTVHLNESHLNNEKLREIFDSLDMPNFSLTKEKSDTPKEDLVKFCSQSLPNLQVPSLKITPYKADKSKKEEILCQSASYIIGRATLTYTTRQKINIHVVGNEQPTSNLTSSPLAYPMNVVSVFKNDIISNRDLSDVTAVDNTHKRKDKSEGEPPDDRSDEIMSLNCLPVFDDSKLVKPSDIINTIRVNNSLLKSDFISEQFQKELNFIDSFFESLQYLESCSLTDKRFTGNKVENWVSKSGFDIKNPEYDSFFSKLENGTIIDDAETMASKSLCLLNLLIRDEQRRANNLLFVLKMREDALKDFTKSQILWLENKKKQDNTDISTLKKKQRGALLKLQHECGEMQRMRKGLLALSEKRKLALMKTKKNIELKLNNHVSVDQILLNKKKLKRSTSADRITAPLKCFDLSSSGCEESSTSRLKSEGFMVFPKVLTALINTESAEKSIQTGDSLLEPVCVDQSTDTAAENFVAVDGAYLNILFHNLSLPQIFSSGKQYEVNEEALRNIVSSSNTHQCGVGESDVIEKFVDQIKNRGPDISSSPSTARSLVEELDQYYKSLAEEEGERSPSSPKDMSITEESRVLLDETRVQSMCTVTVDNESLKASKETADLSCLCEETQVFERDRRAGGLQAGPVPEPAGVSADVEPADVPLHQLAITTSSYTTTVQESSASSQALCSGLPSMYSLQTPAHSEAEELRRQQLAIEKEIKALEQQQSQLLVVREIPDKPPPPYTPPTDARVPKLPRMFLLDESTEQKIAKHITEPSTSDGTDAFDVFIKDFCQEMLQKENADKSDKPWDACNLLPQKPLADVGKLVRRTSEEMKEILTSVAPTVVSGVSARRSDHIDDILFAEWRRCEPEWTSLHSDEAIVKNQIFEGIFQKILTETVDEYKKTVLTHLPQ